MYKRSRSQSEGKACFRPEIYSIGWRPTITARLVPYALVVTMLVVGFVIGGTATSSLDTDTRRQIQEVLQQFFVTAPGTIVPSGELVARQALGGELVRSGLFMWVLGLTVIGAPLVLVISLLRGFALGFTTTFIIEELGWRGGVLSAAGFGSTQSGLPSRG